MKRLMILLSLVALITSGCWLHPEADIRIVSWAQPRLETYFGLVGVIYEVENTGSIGIHDFELRITVTCTDTSQYGTRVERSVTIKSGDTFREAILIDVFGKEADAVMLTHADYHS